MKARIRGQVQGVAFRFHARRQALGLGLFGWVRNLSDGSVELCAEGPRERLESLLDWCQQGPDFAQVDELEQEFVPAEGSFDDFRIKG